MNLVKSICGKSTANTILNVKDWMLSPKISKIRMSTLALPNITVEVLARSLGQAKEIRCIQIERKVKLSVFAENMTLY